MATQSAVVVTDDGDALSVLRGIEYWYYFQDSVDPVVTGVVPVSGASLGPSSSVSFDTTDETSLALVTVFVEYPSGLYEVAYDGVDFSSGFDAASTRTPITGGYTFVIQRDSEWPEPPTLHIRALDNGGNSATADPVYVLNYRSNSDTIEIDDSVVAELDVPADAAPVVANASPPLDSVIGVEESVSFDVVDSTGIQRIIVLVLYPSGVYEVIHDGDGFADGFSTHSTRSFSVDTYHFEVRPNTQWAENPTIRVIAYDMSGNEAS